MRVGNPYLFFSMHTCLELENEIEEKKAETSPMDIFLSISFFRRHFLSTQFTYKTKSFLLHLIVFFCINATGYSEINSHFVRNADILNNKILNEPSIKAKRKNINNF